jgi:D-alanyl-D-alanine dipeptidase
MSRKLTVVFALLLSGPAVADHPLVDIETIAPSIVVEARYFGSDNFVGRPIDGYLAPKCLLSEAAASALGKAQDEFAAFGLSIKVFDCYRPQPAVDHFMRWTRDVEDIAKKAEFYPDIQKSRLVPDGYIAERSGHSRASTVDLSLVVAATGEELDMGSAWDYFDVMSHTENMSVSLEARRNRLLLRSVLHKHGFDNYSAEWWHFTLRNEPFPETYFSHPVK